jgi:HK97 family phage portal protein
VNILKKAQSALNSLWAPEWYLRNGYYRIASLLGAGQMTDSGEHVNVSKALRCGPVNACTRAICDPIASMPLEVVRKVNFQTTFQRESAVYRLLNRAPNDYQTPQVFRRLLISHALNYGNGFAKVGRRGNMGEPFALVPLHPTQFIKKDIVLGEPKYVFRIGSKEQVFSNKEIFHLQDDSDDGLTGMGRVEVAKEAIGRALAMEAYGATFFGRGGIKAGLLKRSMPFKDMASQQRFEESWQEKYRNGKESFHRNVLLVGGSKEDGWNWEAIGSSPTEAQLVEAMSEVVAQICRYYGVSPTLAQDLSNAHYNNIEHLWRSHLNNALTPWMEKFEQEAYRILLTDSQKADGWYFRHDAAGFLRGDFKTLVEAIGTMLEKGLISIDEGREMIDFDPVPNGAGKAFYIQLNRQTVPGTGEPTATEQATLAGQQGANNG